MLTAIIFVIVLAALIFAHELGHFLAAKSFGIRVDAFALGFGPKIFSRTKGETVYSLNFFPFGGYVKIFGENPDNDSVSGPDSKRSFVNKPRLQQAIVLFAGVFFNFIFAWILYATVFVVGVTATSDGFDRYARNFTNPRIMITQVLPGSPADKAGIKVGDVLVTDDSVKDVQERVNLSKGNILGISFKHKNEFKTVEIIPVQSLVENKYAVGIAMNEVADLKLPLITAIYEGGHYTLVVLKETAKSLYSFIANIFQGTADFSSVAGPIGIAGIVGNAAGLGFTYLLMITAVISINLGLINLLPFPALDGGRIFFLAIESVIRRRIPSKFGNAVNVVGFVSLMALMVLVTYKDIVKLIK